MVVKGTSDPMDGSLEFRGKNIDSREMDILLDWKCFRSLNRRSHQHFILWNEGLFVVVSLF
jgi:hypothetical protein